MKKYKSGQVLKSIERAIIPVYNMELTAAITYIHFGDKVIVLEHIIGRHTRSNYTKILFCGNRVGLVFNYEDRWEEVTI